MAIIALRMPTQQDVAAESRLGALLPGAGRFVSDRPLRLVAFLRHTGCPFAEQTVKELRHLADRDARVAVFLLGHGDAGTSAKWLDEIGGCGSAFWIDDPARGLYGECGLGYSSPGHFLGPTSLSAAITLRSKGIRNRVASGTRWQKAGAFLIDRSGRVVWKQVPATANEVPREGDVMAAIESALHAHLGRVTG